MVRAPGLISAVILLVVAGALLPQCHCHRRVSRLVLGVRATTEEEMG
jgi:hypothetical protein